MAGLTRRRLMKKAAGIALGALSIPTIWIRKAPAAWARGTLIHPGVNQLRVAGVTDPRMTKETAIRSNWGRQNELVVSEVVGENIDRLACALAETKSPREAWRAIFVKPPQKSWSDTRVAIKTNHIARQHTRSAVMAKVCGVLTGIGIKPSHIFIYDGVHGGGLSRETPFAGLPEGCRIMDRWGGVSTGTTVSAPWERRDGKAECLRALVDGTVDILINIAMCKGHSTTFGGFTMSMKNHFGTFDPEHGHRSGALDYLIAINQTREILGPMDPQTGRILYPRQQLCLVDALWASKGGPGGLPSHQPNFLAMGVFAPVVDFMVATRFRGEKMGWQPEMEATRRFLSEFGYLEKDLPGGGKIIEV